MAFSIPTNPQSFQPTNCDPYICIDFLESSCPNSSSCPFYHSDTPIQWQLQDQMGNWVDFTPDQNEALEREYSDPNIDGLVLSRLLRNCPDKGRNLENILGNLNNWIVEFNSGPLRLEDTTNTYPNVELRRLCTQSSSVRRSKFASEWIWYYQDSQQRSWVPLDQQVYGSTQTVSEMVEEFYNTGKSKCALRVGNNNDTWIIDFDSWTIQNQGGNVTENIRFRPRSMTQNRTQNSIVQWEFLDMNNQWIPYGGVGYHGFVSGLDSAEIERQYQRNNNGNLNFTTGQFRYRLNFSRMQQINLDTGTARNVRRFVSASSSLTNQNNDVNFASTRQISSQSKIPNNPVTSISRQQLSSAISNLQNNQQQFISKTPAVPKKSTVSSVHQGTNSSPYLEPIDKVTPPHNSVVQRSSSAVSSVIARHRSSSPVNSVANQQLLVGSVDNNGTSSTNLIDTAGASQSRNFIPSLDNILAVTGVSGYLGSDDWILVCLASDSNGYILHITQIPVLTCELLEMNLDHVTKTMVLPAPEPVICVDYLMGTCPEEEFCEKYHSKTTYLWEISTSGEFWIGLPSEISDFFERNYCNETIESFDVGMEFVDGIKPDDHPLVVLLRRNSQWEASFDPEMTLRERVTNQELQLRRVSTPSSAVIGKSSYSTTWKWYYKNLDSWEKYGFVDGTNDDVSGVLESMYSDQCEKTAIILSNRTRYQIDFEKFKHIEDGGTETDVRRRPVKFMDVQVGNLIDFDAVPSSTEVVEPANQINNSKNENLLHQLSLEMDEKSTMSDITSSEDKSRLNVQPVNQEDETTNEHGLLPDQESTDTNENSAENSSASNNTNDSVSTIVSKHLTVLDKTDNNVVKIFDMFKSVETDKIISNIYCVKNIKLRAKYNEEKKYLETVNKSGVKEHNLFYIATKKSIDEICEKNFPIGNSSSEEFKNYAQFISSPEYLCELLKTDSKNELVAFCAEVLVGNSERFSKMKIRKTESFLHPEVNIPPVDTFEDRQNRPPKYYLKFSEQYLPTFVIEFSNKSGSADEKFAETAV